MIIAIISWWYCLLKYILMIVPSRFAMGHYVDRAIFKLRTWQGPLRFHFLCLLCLVASPSPFKFLMCEFILYVKIVIIYIYIIYFDLKFLVSLIISLSIYCAVTIRAPLNGSKGNEESGYYCGSNGSWVPNFGPGHRGMSLWNWNAQLHTS